MEAGLEDALNIRGIGYLFCAANALLVFDFLVVLPHEIQHIWSRKVSLATILYFTIRYAPLISRVAVVYSLMPNPDTQTCMIVSWIYEFLVFFTLSSIALLSALRIYAIWSLRLGPLVMVLSTGMILPIIHLTVRTITLTTRAQPLPARMDCQLFLANPHNIQVTSVLSPRAAELLIFISRFAATASDGLIVLLIWLKVFATYKVLVLSKLPFRSSVIRMLLKDGVLYFMFLLVVNLSLLLASGLTNKDFDGSFDVIVALSSILMCRFIIDLRKVKTDSRPSLPLDLNSSSVEFTSNPMLVWQPSMSLRILESLDRPIADGLVGGGDEKGGDVEDVREIESSFQEIGDEQRYPAGSGEIDTV